MREEREDIGPVTDSCMKRLIFQILLSLSSILLAKIAAELFIFKLLAMSLRLLPYTPEEKRGYSNMRERIVNTGVVVTI